MNSSEIKELYGLFQLKEQLENNLTVLDICKIDYDVYVTFKPNTENYSGGKKFTLKTYWNKWEKELASQLYEVAIKFYKNKYDETMVMIDRYKKVDNNENVEN